MLKIYGGDLSAPSNKVRFVANELGLDYEYIQVRLRDGEHRQEPFLKLNPVGKIPVMDDDGFVLFESGAICKYLINKHKSPLYPGDLKQRAVVDQWADFVAIHINGAMGRVLFNRVFAPFAKVPVDERSLEDGLKFLNRFLPVVDNRLGASQFLAGGSMTLADMSLVATIDPFAVAKIDLTPYENLKKFYEDMKTKTFYTKCYKEYGDALKALKQTTK